MKQLKKKCKNHPQTDAISFCHVCKHHFCNDCLLIGPQYYYCKSKSCKQQFLEATNYSENPRFCPKCISETSDESSGDSVSVNYIMGDRFHMESNRHCSTCGSVVVQRSGSFFSKKEEYRVIWLDQDRTRFYARLLKN